MKPETLKKEVKKIKWFITENIDQMPFSQGYLAVEIIKRYNIHAKQIGYHMDVIGIKTNKQIIVHKDTGIGARFLGIINISDGSVDQHPKEEKQQENKIFDTLQELRREVKKRDYNNIKGLKAKVTYHQYMDMLEALPPLKMLNNGFVMREALSDQLYESYFYIGEEHFCEIVQLEDEEIMKLETEYRGELYEED